MATIQRQTHKRVRTAKKLETEKAARSTPKRSESSTTSSASTAGASKKRAVTGAAASVRTRRASSSLRPSEQWRPSEQEIAELAYELYQQRGSVDGRHEDDWHRAEKILVESFRKASAVVRSRSSA